MLYFCHSSFIPYHFPLVLCRDSKSYIYPMSGKNFKSSCCLKVRSTVCSRIWQPRLFSVLLRVPRALTVCTWWDPPPTPAVVSPPPSHPAGSHPNLSHRMINHERSQYVQMWNHKIRRHCHPGGGWLYHLENPAGTQTCLLEELLKANPGLTSQVYGVS